MNIDTTPFAGLSPSDGFSIERVEMPADRPINTSLHVVLKGGGLRQRVNVEDDCVELLEIENPTPAQLGSVDRLEHLLKAVCRYLNTGGSWQEMAPALKVMNRAVPSGLVFPGFFLLESYVNTAGDFEHVYAQEGEKRAGDDQDCVLWVEGDLGFIEPKSLEEIKREQETGGDDLDIDWEADEEAEEAEEAEDGLDAADGVPLQLPGGPDHPDEERSGPGPQDGVPGGDGPG